MQSISCFKLSSCNPNSVTQNMHAFGIILILALPIEMCYWEGFSNKDQIHERQESKTKLKDLIESSGQTPKEAFQTVFGKEKLGRVRCCARTTTPTLLKRKEEIEEIEKRHANEVKHLNDKVEEMEAKHKQEMSAMDKKYQLLLKTVINQNNSGLNVEALTTLLTTPGDANSVPGSSTSTHIPNIYEPHIGLANQNPLDDNLLDMEEDEDAYLDS